MNMIFVDDIVKSRENREGTENEIKGGKSAFEKRNKKSAEHG